MNINDPSLDSLLKKSTTYKNKTKPLEKIELPKLSKKKCIHKIPFDKCATCQCIEAGASSDHEIARAVFIRLAPIPSYPGNNPAFTKGQRGISQDQKEKHAGFILSRKQASEYDTLLWISQEFNQEYRTDQEMKIFKYLFAKFYDFKATFPDQEKPKIESIDADLLAGIRKHVFEVQLNAIKRAMKYNGIVNDE